MYNEADTRANLIDPKLNRAGWTRSQVTREHYYAANVQYTDGRIYLRGNEAKRHDPRRVDYVLRYTAGFQIAAVEAKAEGKSALSGLQQAKDYARDLGLLFAYATNGHDIIEWDATTNQTQEIEEFPSPNALWERWRVGRGLVEVPPSSADFTQRISENRPLYNVDDAAARRRNPLLHPYDLSSKQPRYYQEIATERVISRVMQGQKRILLTMATGTGKTFTAFQIVWKLLQSGWLRANGSGRVLFLADRVVLRDQAYNAFGSFASDKSEPRFLVDGRRKLSHNRTLYFAIYQNLWAEQRDGTRLFEQFAPDFFDLIIIDEAHRSGWGSWKEILDHFGGAVHLGMTATPKQTENIDTYAYFCAEEPETIDPRTGNPTKMPAFTYSLGQGIEDGFLAMYKIHWVRTNVDKDGLNIEEAIEQGAELFVPEEVTVNEDYQTPAFERAITLPDRTSKLTAHLAGLLRRFGEMQKTMVFCVDSDHAREVARLLNNHFSHLGYEDDYAAAILSDEGESGRRRLRQFQDSDKYLPVVATTAELLSTGVDVPSARNIVFMKTLRSPILFKQIVGRGTRIDGETGKLWFRIVDYTGATRLIDKGWDAPPTSEIVQPDTRPQTATVRGTVRLGETGDLLIGAAVALLVGANDQRGPILTDENGRFVFERVPVDDVTLIVSGPGVRQRQMTISAEDGATTTLDVELERKADKPFRKIEMTGLTVEIAEEATFIVEGMNEPLTLEAYIDYTKEQLLEVAQSWEELLGRWRVETSRETLRERLTARSIFPDVLGQLLDQPDADELDVLGHVAYDRAWQTRYDRSLTVRQRERAWLQNHPAPAREVVYALLNKYELGGVDELTNPAVFRVSPFREMGEIRGVLRRFGGQAVRLKETLGELQQQIYAS